MSKFKLPRTLAIVVKSDVLGPIAVSVEATPFPTPAEHEGNLFVSVSEAAIEDAVDEQETRYLDSQTKPEPKVKMDVVPADPFAQKAQILLDRGETWDGFAESIGWWRKANGDNGGKTGSDDEGNRTRPDGEKVRYYILGFRGQGRKDIPANVARELCQALDLDPVDVGI